MGALFLGANSLWRVEVQNGYKPSLDIKEALLSRRTILVQRLARCEATDINTSYHFYFEVGCMFVSFYLYQIVVKLFRYSGMVLSYLKEGKNEETMCCSL